MTTYDLVINPEEVNVTWGSYDELPAWLSQIATYVQRAAAEGDLITLTAKPRLMTPAQVAERTGMSRSTISRKIASGEIRAFKVGNRNRISFEEFQKFWKSTMGEVVEMTSEELRADLFD